MNELSRYQRANAYFRNHIQAPLVALTAVGLLVAFAGIWWQQQVNNAQNRQRITDQHSLSVCVSGILGQLVGSLPPVRVATQKRDTANRHIVLDLAKVVALASENKTASPAFKAQFADDLIGYLRADSALSSARKANPYPKTPHVLCVLDKR